jgi:hypothetical protein
VRDPGLFAPAAQALHGGGQRGDVLGHDLVEAEIAVLVDRGPALALAAHIGHEDLAALAREEARQPQARVRVEDVPVLGGAVEHQHRLAGALVSCPQAAQVQLDLAGHGHHERFLFDDDCHALDSAAGTSRKCSR